MVNKLEFCPQKKVSEKKGLFILLDIPITRIGPVLDSFYILRQRKWKTLNIEDKSWGINEVEGQDNMTCHTQQNI